MSDPLFIVLFLLLITAILALAELAIHRSETDEHVAARVIDAPRATAG